MGLFIGASILTVLELFDYAYEVRPKMLCPIPVGSTQPPRHHLPLSAGAAHHGGVHLEAESHLLQVIKHRLCRRGKCRKNHKRNNTDKGVALSMDDVKRHVSAGPRVSLGALSASGGEVAAGTGALGRQGSVLGETCDHSIPSLPLQNPCESLRGHPAGMTYAANILPHHPARGTFEDFTC